MSKYLLIGGTYDGCRYDFGRVACPPAFRIPVPPPLDFTDHADESLSLPVEDYIRQNYRAQKADGLPTDHFLYAINGMSPAMVFERLLEKYPDSTQPTEEGTAGLWKNVADLLLFLPAGVRLLLVQHLLQNLGPVPDQLGGKITARLKAP